jgi:hypothetical protein
MEKICSFLSTPKNNGVLQRKIPVHAAESSKAKPCKALSNTKGGAS